MLLFALVWFSTAWFGSWEFNPNNSTRMFAALSLVEQGDATIDEYAHLTIDKARFGDHVYLDKAPGMTLMAVPILAAFQAVTGEDTRFIDKRIDNPVLVRFLRIRLRAVAVLTSGLLTAIAAVALWSLAGQALGNSGAGLFAAIAYALGSPAWGWATTVFGHASVGALLIIALWAAWRGSDGAAASIRLMAVAGLAIGWAVVIENQAALAGALIALWALWRVRALSRRTPAAAALVASGIAALLPMVAYNLVAFGEPLKFGYAGVVGFDGMREGFFGLTYPKPGVLAALLIGARRGLFWVAPLFILAPFGLWQMAKDAATRDLAIVAAGVATIVLLVNASYVYWDGGYSTGPRHSVPAIPFLALGLGWIWARAHAGRRWLVALAMLSVAINFAVAAAEIAAPDTEPWPLWKPVFVQFMAGDYRDVPSEFFGLSPWLGMAIYLTVAGLICIALIQAQTHRHRRLENIY